MCQSHIRQNKIQNTCVYGETLRRLEFPCFEVTKVAHRLGNELTVVSKYTVATYLSFIFDTIVNTLRTGAFKLFKCTFPVSKQFQSTFILCFFKNL